MNRREASRLRRLDRRRSWKPFTDMREYLASEPHIIERGRGRWLYDSEGRRLLDAVSSLWCNLLGHRVPEIDRAVREQLGRAAHTTSLGPTHPAAIELADRLVRMAPEGLERVFYTDSGSEAVEVALKLAVGHWRHRGRPEKSKIVCLAESYHGDTLGAVSVGGIEVFHSEWRKLCFEAIRVPSPACHACPRSDSPSCGRKCLAALERLLAERSGEIAALVIEPRIQAAAGMLFAWDGYLREARRLTRKYDVLLIADEVATGFGRTGKRFACDHEGVRPDLLCLAKGLTGGYLPLAVTLATGEIFESFLAQAPGERRVFYHGHTYTANPLGCAAALAAMKLYLREEPKLRRRSRELAKALAPLGKLPHVAGVRLLGLMGGVELIEDKGFRKPFDPKRRVGAAACRAALDHGVLVRPLGDLLVVMPPINTTPPEMRHLARGLAAAIRQVTG
ncbi:MAG TPA: adenosylmethionine--8-amino-7-oxononanoate transaminase [Planctomycetota bacterium]|nr:adenosylmethionine--8-amino-7-oxononanoate transaminase [Planctomycetota bacterium]